MGDGDGPRKHDHLVEPMYEALREPPGEPVRRRSRRRRWLWLAALLAGTALLIWALAFGPGR